MTRSPAHVLRRILGSVVKWAWLGLFVLITLGYLSSGLSESEIAQPPSTERLASEKIASSSAAAVADPDTDTEH